MPCFKLRAAFKRGLGVNENRNTPHVIGFMACVGFRKIPALSVTPGRPQQHPTQPARPLSAHATPPRGGGGGGNARRLTIYIYI